MHHATTLHRSGSQIRLNVHQDSISRAMREGGSLHRRAQDIRKHRAVHGPLLGGAAPRSFALAPNSAVFDGDYGDVLAHLTNVVAPGALYAVLNMANAYRPGGGPGCPAQEENMMQRSDASVLYAEENKIESTPILTPPPYRVPLGETVLFYSHPRVLFKGKEVRNADNSINLEKSFAPIDPIEFYEFRSAAVDTRDLEHVDYGDGSHGGIFHPEKYTESMRRRIHNQLTECKRHGAEYVLLSAFGCGAFMNAAIGRWAVRTVALLYREAVQAHAHEFKRIDFAIYSSYGADNYRLWKHNLE